MKIRRKTIRRIVQSLLHNTQISEPPVPVEVIAHALDLKICLEPFEGDISGCTIRKADKAVIGVNSLHHPNRQRFTIAHEIGHFLLHKGEEIIVDRNFRVSFRDGDSGKAEKPEEIEANYFAAELLMPADFLIGDLQDKLIDIEDDALVKEVAERYRVSPQALNYRLLNLKYLTQ
jgi:Zn-dependent peptidase ImmA (M78 family)